MVEVIKKILRDLETRGEGDNSDKAKEGFKKRHYIGAMFEREVV